MKAQEHAGRSTLFAWAVVAVAVCSVAWSFSEGLTFRGPEPFGVPDIVFWIAILAVAQLLPVSLGFETQVTMAFPIVLASAILFPPPVAMTIAGIGSLDLREIRREIPLVRALFNRAQVTLATGVASLTIDVFDVRQHPFVFPKGAVAITIAGVMFLIVNLGLVVAIINRYHGIPLREAVRDVHPDPVAGFLLSQALLGGLGVAAAAAYLEIHGFVALFLIPLLFARLSLLGARSQQELSERVQKQQEALLGATEKVFAERESERKRIAEDIHDSSLQMLAAAAYGCGNANEFLDAGRVDQARAAVASAREAVERAMTELRGSLVRLRRSSVEEGGLMETIRNYTDQVSTLWGSEIRIEGDIENEPPIPVSLAAFQILQEGLVNALKHSRGESVAVKIRDEEGMVHIVVEDDGAGFDPDSQVGTDHVGMRLMRERAARVGGRITLDSTPGHGTRLEAILPGGVAQ